MSMWAMWTVYVLVDDGDARVIVLGLRDLIELDDNVGDGRGDLLQADERPLLERLGKNRVVSVGDHGAYDGHGLVKTRCRARW